MMIDIDANQVRPSLAEPDKSRGPCGRFVNEAPASELPSVPEHIMLINRPDIYVQSDVLLAIESAILAYQGESIYTNS